MITSDQIELGYVKCIDMPDLFPFLEHQSRPVNLKRSKVALAGRGNVGSVNLPSTITPQL